MPITADENENILSVSDQRKTQTYKLFVTKTQKSFINHSLSIMKMIIFY